MSLLCKSLLHNLHSRDDMVNIERLSVNTAHNMFGFVRKYAVLAVIQMVR